MTFQPVGESRTIQQIVLRQIGTHSENKLDPNWIINYNVKNGTKKFQEKKWDKLFITLK